MSTNDNFNSKKIIEEIEHLENDPENKSVKKKSALASFFEKLILKLIIIATVIAVGAQFIEELFVDYENNYTQEIESNYEIDNSYTETDNEEILDNKDYSNSIPEGMTIEEFMNSELKNTLLTEKVQENTIEAEVINEVENTIVENTVVENFEYIPKDDVEVIVEEYDEEKIVKERFEEEKKNLVITKEGFSLNNELIISVENKNTNFVNDLTIYTILYGRDGIEHIDMQGIDIILEGKKKYLKIENMPEGISKFETFITKNDYYEYTNELLTENVSYNHYIEDEIIEVDITNNGKKIDKVSFTILYYDRFKNILDIDTVSDHSIRKYFGGNVTGYGVWDNTNECYINYDSYEVILDYAESYEY